MNTLLARLKQWLSGRSRLPSDFRPPGPIADLQLELTGLALKVGDAYGIKLDFSSASIRSVERILSAIHKEYRRTGMEDGLNGIALEFGAYIASTIQRQTGEGQLDRDHPDFGEASFPFRLRETTIFPYMWCIKRIFDGDGDNVWTKYQVCVLGK